MMVRIWVLSIVIVLSSCKKDDNLEDYLPQVEMISAQVNSLGQLELKGRVLDTGTSDLDYVGFCFDTINPPNILANQILLSGSIGQTFEKVIQTDFAYNTDSPIYVNAFAANATTYGIAVPVLLETSDQHFFPAPCELAPNSITIFSTNSITSIDPIVPSGIEGINTFSVNYFNVECRFYFQNLQAGIYQTVTGIGQIDEPLDMLLVVDFNPNEYPAYDGAEIYVSAIDVGLYEVEVCPILYSYPNSVSMRFVIEGP